MALILTTLFLTLLAAPVWPSFREESLTAKSALLMDADTGEILYQREPDLELPPASTTKIVTAIVALESALSRNSLLRVSREATRVPSTKLYLRPGQKMSMSDLLYGLLLSSANDASVVLAEGVAGSVARFAAMMNKKARAIGAMHSHFVNPHGLTAPDHYSTARDMALIFNYAMKNPAFRKIIQTKASSVSSVSSGKVRRIRHIYVRSHNRLLWNFDGAIGGKTGYTYAAQKCFVGGVSRDGETLIVALLGSRDLWGDTRRLLEYGLENYGTLKAAAAPAQPDGHAVLRAEKPSAPIFTWDEEKKVGSLNGYVLQIASFRERDRAESLEKWITADGYQAFLEKVPLDNGETTYRVRVGPYPQLSNAQAAAREIESKSGFRAIILPVASSASAPGNPS